MARCWRHGAAVRSVTDEATGCRPRRVAAALLKVPVRPRSARTICQMATPAVAGFKTLVACVHACTKHERHGDGLGCSVLAKNLVVDDTKQPDLICKGARESAFRTHKSMSECLADEIIAASKGVGQGTVNSYAVKKKDEIERVAKGNR